MSQKPILQQRLMEAIPSLTDADFNYHATDLYVRGSMRVRQWLRNHYEHWENVRPFASQLDGSLWYDIPFAGYWPTERHACTSAHTPPHIAKRRPTQT